MKPKALVSGIQKAAGGLDHHGGGALVPDTSGYVARARLLSAAGEPVPHTAGPWAKRSHLVAYGFQ